MSDERVNVHIEVEYKGNTLKGWSDAYQGYDAAVPGDETYMAGYEIGLEDAEKDKDMGRYGSSNA